MSRVAGVFTLASFPYGPPSAFGRRRPLRSEHNWLVLVAFRVAPERHPKAVESLSLLPGSTPGLRLVLAVPGRLAHTLPPLDGPAWDRRRGLPR